MDTIEQEKAAEQAALAEVKEEEIRTSIVNEFGFDPEADKEKIDKMTTKELEHRKKLSSAIGQKIKVRNERDELQKKVAPPIPPKDDKKENEISPKDVYTLIDAKVHREDISDVQDYAKLKNITIDEALKSSTVKAILADKTEARRVADATNTAPARRSVATPTDESILSDASSGKLPEDPSKVAEARIRDKKAKK